MNSDEYGSDDDELDEFEESVNEETLKKKGDSSYSNKPYDEAYEVSQELSMAESFDGRDVRHHGGGRDAKQIRNDKYDEAVEVSQSIDQGGQFSSVPNNKGRLAGLDAKSDSHGKPIGLSSISSSKAQPSILGEQTKSTNIANRPFDEALEFSQEDESGESIDTRNSEKRKGGSGKKQVPLDIKGVKGKPGYEVKALSGGASGSGGAGGAMGAGRGGSLGQTPMSSGGGKPTLSGGGGVPSHAANKSQASPKSDNNDDDEDESSSDEEEGNEQESYDNLEGAYNPKDYSHLNVAADVRDLFQYIERYKPHEVELETTLKCFIPEYIPAIGEMDAFVKVPRPDGKPDFLGLKILDEPSSQQSDPTVLELQLRATSKKQQYGNVSVRSIEDAAKNPGAIDKWIQSISELHRSKPPPQVHYKRNMPELEKLMDVWPEEFEAALEKLRLPSPDLDLTLPEYARLLCSVVDIPTYENPIESLHHFFELYMAFRDNPHFQARGRDNNLQDRGLDVYGGADVMQVMQGYK